MLVEAEAFEAGAQLRTHRGFQDQLATRRMGQDEAACMELQLQSGGWSNVIPASNFQLHRWEYSSIPGPCSAFGEALAGWVNATEAFTSTSAAMNANAIFFNMGVILVCSVDRDHSLPLRT